MKRFLSLPIDWFLLAIPLLLVVVGTITIYTITFNQYHTSLAVDQAIFAALGVVALLGLMFSDYRFLGSIAGLLYAAGLLLLIPLLPPLAPKLPFVLKVFGAYRWLNFGIFQLQPAEIFKLIAGIAAAKYLSGYISAINWKRLLGYVALTGIPTALVLLQPDLGTTAVVFTVFCGIFLAARPSGKTIALAGVALVIALTVAWFSLQDYQKQRIETFLNPASDPQGEGYNVRQALIAIGSGGLTGRGFGQGSQSVLNFLPVAHADFIFAGYAEATGFVGSGTLLILYVVLIHRIIAIASSSTDPFGRLLAIGIGSKLMFQVTVHIGMNLGLLPVTGIPLPFMSYGGTALVIDLASIGVLQSIYIRHKRALFAS
ncbi:MAG: rod shape-determining protein RodA [Candidatus Berkelbacteria bacterium]|nr:MAG: rod shape-determining protein RodA [Candidatus Berkelbacteria bacterium]QQG51457.1 MAG: rod shape-determining protein RodA [Candidatus Berkelbacteria bacterium]